MSDSRDDSFYRPLGLSLGMHIALAVVMTVGWYWHTDQQTMAPPAMMKAALVYAPKSTMPQQKTQTQKPDKPKPQPDPEPPKPEPPTPEPPKPEPPKPEPPKPDVVKPEPKKPDIKPVDKPSPVAAKPEPPKPPPKPEPAKPDPKKPATKDDTKKQPDKKVEPPKPDAKQADKKQDAKSAIDKEKTRKDADMAIQAMLNDEEITRTGELTDAQLLKWTGLIADRIEQNWNRPPNARQGMVVVLQIELSRSGQVVNVSIVQGSGDKAFDLAAEAAVRKVETFKDIIDQMKPEEFKVFQKFNLEFNPQDLVL